MSTKSNCILTHEGKWTVTPLYEFVDIKKNTYLYAMNRKYIIHQISEILNELAPDSLRLLYGSEARGESRADSDIDVLIVLPDNLERGSFAKRKTEITGRLYDVELSTGVIISPLIVLKSFWERMQTPFTINVAKDGISI